MSMRDNQCHGVGARNRMKDLNNLGRSAMEAVAQRFSATWETGSDPADARITVAGKRVAVDIATLKPRRATSQRAASKLRLRFDKVATRLIEGLQAAVAETAPDGMTVLLTVTAPIRLPSKTAAALCDKIQTLLRRGAPGGDAQYTIHGNRARIRLLKQQSPQAPKMFGFVHNPDADPLLLLDMTRDLLKLIGATARSRAATLPGDRWLVLTSAAQASYLDAYRYICSELRIAAGFDKILMVFGDGRVELLTG
jgi:hypothetical protein